ncbi:respiratory nitrate reductase subunit gamma [Streptomyces sp. NPDC006274]|uniref:respiratory nitrate reductase subunit gamma n=1 Tax=unclassified Streptomyces TaxID=2593676 RepID=UPI0033A1EAED
MTGVPLLFRLPALSAPAVFAVWAFTRLVHMLTAPLGYSIRPCIEPVLRRSARRSSGR